MLVMNLESFKLYFFSCFPFLCRNNRYDNLWCWRMHFRQNHNMWTFLNTDFWASWKFLLVQGYTRRYEIFRWIVLGFVRCHYDVMIIINVFFVRYGSRYPSTQNYYSGIRWWVETWKMWGDLFPTVDNPTVVGIMSCNCPIFNF